MFGAFAAGIEARKEGDESLEGGLVFRSRLFGIAGHHGVEEFPCRAAELFPVKCKCPGLALWPGMLIDSLTLMYVLGCLVTQFRGDRSAGQDTLQSPKVDGCHRRRGLLFQAIGSFELESSWTVWVCSWRFVGRNEPGEGEE